MSFCSLINPVHTHRPHLVEGAVTKRMSLDQAIARLDGRTSRRPYYVRGRCSWKGPFGQSKTLVRTLGGLVGCGGALDTVSFYDTLCTKVVEVASNSSRLLGRTHTLGAWNTEGSADTGDLCLN